MAYTTIFFDLDDTLYPPTTGLWDAIGTRINKFLIESVGINPEKAPALRDHLWRAYGTTLRGLQAVYHIDPAPYLAYVHDVPLEKYISPNPDLRLVLAQIPQRKIIFTNADIAHARRVLKVLDIEEYFDQIIDVQAIAPFCKPMPEALHSALTLAGESAENCILVEDMPHNLAPARQMGLYTVLVGRQDNERVFNAAIPTILEIRSALPG